MINVFFVKIKFLVEWTIAVHDDDLGTPAVAKSGDSIPLSTNLQKLGFLMSFVMCSLGIK